ncbi:methionine--tRNA ligase [candidate division KSB1 bacterium]|nr:methionine--tRNA ligase [candidate division KSB1 bacterium]
MSEYKRILVTSALLYANGPIHLGHLAGAYLPADIYVRFQRLKWREVVFISGSDEHGVPITILADKKGVTPKEIVDHYHRRNQDAFYKVGIRFDNYSRTSLPAHHELSQDFFLRLLKKGHLVEKTVQQYFCQSCQRFLPDRYVEGTCPHCQQPGARGDQCEKCGKWIDQITLVEPQCTICHQKPELRSSKHWFLKLGDFQPQIENWLQTKTTWKTNVLNFCKGWLTEGLRDRAITRDINWGVPVPVKGYENKVLYVWFDAPIGYISATKEWAEQIGQPERWRDFWFQPDTRLIHFIGKDNIVFHAIVWPSFLMGYEDYILPAEIPANEFLNLEGEKFSTSRNYAVWLEDYLQRFDPDILRYVLAVNAPESKDADFSWKDFQTRNNSELADILGNFINRSLTFLTKNFDRTLPQIDHPDTLDYEMLAKISEARTLVAENLEQFEVRKAITNYMNLARFANKYFNDQQPWLSIRQDPVKCGATLNICVQVIRALSVLGAPFLPFTVEKVWKILQLEGSVHQQHWDQVGVETIPAGHRIGELEILFPKIEDAVIQNEIDRLRQSSGHTSPAPEPVAPPPAVPEPPITYAEFQKVHLRVATVLAAERVPKTTKLLKLQIDLGDETRQIVAGLAEHYAPEALVGRQIVVVANLQPAKLKGIESNGMLLAAEDQSGQLSLLSVATPVANGAKIK